LRVRERVLSSWAAADTGKGGLRVRGMRGLLRVAVSLRGGQHRPVARPCQRRGGITGEAKEVTSASNHVLTSASGFPKSGLSARLASRWES
jgi:hypothetical protein